MFDFAKLEKLILELQDLQEKKVFDLARRLKPKITAEDMRNPHDFSELLDPDWHYQDGLLAGIQSVLVAVRAAERELSSTTFCEKK